MFCLPLSIKQLSITQEFRLEAKLFFVGRLELQKFCRKKSLFSYIFQLQMKFVSVPSEVLCLHRKILFLLGCICSCQSFMFSQRIPSCSGSVVSVPARVLCFHKGFLAVPARLFPFLPEFYVFTKDSCSCSVASVPARVLCFHKGFLFLLGPARVLCFHKGFLFLLGPARVFCFNRRFLFLPIFSVLLVGLYLLLLLNAVLLLLFFKF